MKHNIRLVVIQHPLITAGNNAEFVMYGDGLTQEAITAQSKQECTKHFGIHWQSVMVVLHDGAATKRIFDNWVVDNARN